MEAVLSFFFNSEVLKTHAIFSFLFLIVSAVELYSKDAVCIIISDVHASIGDGRSSTVYR
jgi:hypothetical protein